jgi:hypothetical protein
MAVPSSDVKKGNCNECTIHTRLVPCFTRYGLVNISKQTLLKNAQLKENQRFVYWPAVFDCNGEESCSFSSEDVLNLECFSKEPLGGGRHDRTTLALMARTREAGLGRCLEIVTAIAVPITVLSIQKTFKIELKIQSNCFYRAFVSTDSIPSCDNGKAVHPTGVKINQANAPPSLGSNSSSFSAIGSIRCLKRRMAVRIKPNKDTMR